MRDGYVVLFLAGDVMTGRGIDQILPHPGAPDLREQYLQDAREYVRLAESLNGPIAAPVDVTWPWGDALQILDEWSPDIRVINVETSVTTSDDFAPGKAVHYRMHPANVDCLTVLRPDASLLANNHVLDFGVRGLRETLDTLASVGLAAVGAGLGAEAASRPLVLDCDGRRTLIWSVASPSSGVPRTWAATGRRPGVAFVPDLSEQSAAGIIEDVRRKKRPGDLALVSIHWGSNWGYDVPDDQVRFARWLVDGGVDVVHGHSSHHPRPIEVYRGKLVLYGCGDLVNDYEGIRGYEEYRDDLRLLYFPWLDPSTGDLGRLEMVPLQARQMRLQRALRADSEWLRGVLDKASRPYASRVDVTTDGHLVLRR